MTNIIGVNTRERYYGEYLNLNIANIETEKEYNDTMAYATSTLLTDVVDEAYKEWDYSREIPVLKKWIENYDERSIYLIMCKVYEKVCKYAKENNKPIDRRQLDKWIKCYCNSINLCKEALDNIPKVYYTYDKEYAEWHNISKSCAKLISFGTIRNKHQEKDPWDRETLFDETKDKVVDKLAYSFAQNKILEGISKDEIREIISGLSNDELNELVNLKDSDFDMSEETENLLSNKIIDFIQQQLAKGVNIADMDFNNIFKEILNNELFPSQIANKIALEFVNKSGVDLNKYLKNQFLDDIGIDPSTSKDLQPKNEIKQEQELKMESTTSNINLDQGITFNNQDVLYPISKVLSTSTEGIKILLDSGVTGYINNNELVRKGGKDYISQPTWLKVNTEWSISNKKKVESDKDLQELLSTFDKSLGTIDVVPVSKDLYEIGIHTIKGQRIFLTYDKGGNIIMKKPKLIIKAGANSKDELNTYFVSPKENKLLNRIAKDEMKQEDFEKINMIQPEEQRLAKHIDFTKLNPQFFKGICRHIFESNDALTKILSTKTVFNINASNSETFTLNDKVTAITFNKGKCVSIQKIDNKAVV